MKLRKYEVAWVSNEGAKELVRKLGKVKKI
jgi:hypothetical protein